MAESLTQDTTESTMIAEDVACDIGQENIAVHTLFDRAQMNFETRQLLWCYGSETSYTDSEVTRIVDELRDIIDYTKVFDKVSNCTEYLNQTVDTTSYIICSSDISQTLVTEINYLKQVESIYIYGKNENSDEYWFLKYNKVKKFDDELSSIFVNLKTQVEESLQNEKHGLINDLNGWDGTTDNTLRTSWPEFIDLVCHIPYPSDCRERLVAELKKYYANNKGPLRVINEFATDYKPENAVWWYTRPCFLYSLLNKALRRHNLTIALLFGFVIRDLYRQLQTEYKKIDLADPSKRIIKTFRGQIMSVNEINSFSDDLFESIVLKSFFSTSLDIDVPTAFLESIDPIPKDCARAIMEIDLDLRCRTRPFAEISQLSQIPEEREFLLMPGSTLIVQSTKYQKENDIYLLKLELQDNGYVDKPFLYQDTTLRRTIKKCVKHFANDAEYCLTFEIKKIFDGLIYLYPSEKGWLDALQYECFGDVQNHEQNEDYNQTIGYYQESIKLWMKYIDDDELNSAYNIAHCHSSIVFIYRSYLKNDSLAGEHEKLAMDICKSALKNVKPGPNSAALYDMLAKIYTSKEDDLYFRDIKIEKSMGLEYKKLELQEHLKRNSSDLKSIVRCYQETAEHFHTNSTEALGYLDKASRICIQQNDLESLATIYDKMADICQYKAHDNELTVKYKLLLLEVKEKIYKIHPFHSNREIRHNKWKIYGTHEDVARLYIDLGKSKLARNHLVKVKQLMEDVEQIEPNSMTSYLSRINEQIANIDRPSATSGNEKVSDQTRDNLGSAESRFYPVFRGFRKFRGTCGFRISQSARTSNVTSETRDTSEKRRGRITTRGNIAKRGTKP